MSRSYKKSPWCGDRSPWAKRKANQKVRRYKKDLPNGKAYKKLYCSYNICDYGSYHTLKEALIFAQQPTNIWKHGRSIGLVMSYNEKKETLYWKKFYRWK